MKQNDVVEYLKSISEFEFFSIINEISESRTVKKTSTCGDIQITREYLLASTVWGTKDKIPDTKVEPMFFAQPENGTYAAESAVEAGKCVRCSTEIMSFSRRALCPVCGNFVSCS